WEDRHLDYEKYSRVINQVNEIARTKAKKANERINRSRSDHEYKIGERVLVEKESRSKSDPIYDGPFSIIEIYREGNMVKMEDSKKEITRNIKKIKPFFTE
ncbi:putative LTR transposon, partial [Pseudoloma neurophilia]